MPKTRKRAEPQSPPILTFATEEQTKAADEIVRLLGEVLKTSHHAMPGAHAKMAQFVSSLINPHGSTLAYKDHTGRTRSVTTFSSKVAAERLAAFTDLRTEGLIHEEIGDLVGLSRSGVVAFWERVEGRRARQKRITL